MAPGEEGLVLPVTLDEADSMLGGVLLSLIVVCL